VLSPPPETGQLVIVRTRRWVVSDVQANALRSLPLKPTCSSRQQRVSLTSIEHGVLGEELQVFGEVEPGASV
jgi:hypothetical protein